MDADVYPNLGRVGSSYLRNGTIKAEAERRGLSRSISQILALGKY